MSALLKPVPQPVSDAQVALLVSPERYPALADAFPKVRDLDGMRADDATTFEGIETVVLELAHPDALVFLDTLSRNSPDMAVLVIGDALPSQAVRAMLKLNSSDLAASAAAPGDIVRACGRLTVAAPEGPARQNQCWVITGAVGGAGATTLAIEIACAAAARDPKNSVCLVDLNLADGMIASCLEGVPKLDLMGLADAPERLDPTLLSAYCWEHETGISLISAPRNPDINEFTGPDLVLRLLDTVCTVYSHVIVDMPRTRQAWTKPILSVVDEVLVVSEFTVPSLHAAADMCREVDALRHEASDAKLVLNRMSDAKSDFSVSRAGKAIEREIGAVIRSDWKSAREAGNLGMPVAKVKPRSILVKDILALVEQLDPNEAVAETKKRKLW